MTKIIAELSGNHGGDLSRCLTMIKAAALCGCWAAKFQYYKPQDLPDFDAKVNFPVPWWWLPEMFDLARSRSIVLFASVFSEEAVKELRKYTAIFKVASPESTQLTRYTYDRIAWGIDKKERVFVSSGLRDFWEMKTIFSRGEFLYCKAGYPATINDDDLAFMGKHAVGFSDHTAGYKDTLAMVGAGAQYIEKHFKLDDNCLDAAFSLNPDQMKMLCDLAK